MRLLGLLGCGGAAGLLAGFFGVGGGIIIVPSLIYLFGFTEHQAQGTSLAAMVPPIGLLAAIRYYQAGHIEVRAAALIAVGFILGGWIGAHVAQPIPDHLLRRAFGALALVVGANMLLGR
jgi:hypothetical protein